MPLIALGAVIVTLSGCSIRGAGFSAPKSVQVPSTGISVLRVDAGSGYLRVVGHEGRGDVVITGVAQADSRAIVDGERVETRRSGDTLIVTTIIPVSPPGRFGRVAVALDLMIQLPSGIALDVVDTSGAAFFRNVGALRIVHGDGRLEADTVAGSVDITDGNGDILVGFVGGNVHIVDGGGGIHLFRIHGSVDIPKAGNGEIKLFDVGGDVRVGSKSSGEVVANGIGGSLFVTARGDGSIEYRGVKGRIEIPPRRDHKDNGA